MTLFPRNAADALQRIMFRPLAWNAARSLERSGHPSAIAAATAVTAAFSDRMSSNERTAVTAIEILRTRLESSNEMLTVTDHGARTTSPEGTQRERTLGDITARASKSPLWASLLFHLVRRTAPVRCLELGTCVGISALYQSAALKLNGNGTLVTLEGSEVLAGIARRNFEQMGRTMVVQRVGRFQKTLAPVLEEFGPFDLVFIDGHHDGEATERYFASILPALNSGAVVVADDIRWSAGMRSAWQQLTHHPRTVASAGLVELGIIIVS